MRTETQLAQRLADDLEAQLFEQLGEIEERLGKIEGLSELPVAALRPHIEEEAENLRHQLQSSARLIVKKNQEVSELNA